ncbi:MAG TPA: hypothetical protein VOB72_20350 [Candidatus Dormibacteraeota bacterium]|nr:hypothetical protein [Candidatus Dormibacteraeota bacterium]
MTRLVWFIVAVILVLVGFDLLAREWLGWTGWFVAGVGFGIACAVVGSLLHDALAGTRERLP